MLERVAIVGVGLIGGSLGLALRERRLARHVIGIGRSSDDLQTAIRRGALDSATEDLAEGVTEADVVVLATPVSQIVRDIQRLSDLVSANTIITDVGSTKCEISRAASECSYSSFFVPGHPMAGSERSGIAAARADLFEEATWALTSTDATSPQATSIIRKMAMAVGARVIHLSPDVHDRAVAVTSHLPHVLAYALAAVAGDRAAAGEPVFDLAAGSFRSGTRVASSDPALWQEIALSNRDALAEALRATRLEIDAVLNALESGDAKALKAAFRRGYDAATHAPA